MNNRIDLLNIISVIMLCRLERFVSDNVSECSSDKLSELVKKFGSIPASALEMYLEDDTGKMTDERRRFVGLVSKFPENCHAVASTFLELIIFRAVFPNAASIMKEYQLTVSIQLAHQLETGLPCTPEIAADIYNTAKLLIMPKESDVWYADSEWENDNRFISYIAGDNRIFSDIESMCTVFGKESPLSPRYLSDEPVRTAEQIINRNKAFVMTLKGEEGSGKRFLLRHAARNCGRAVLFADFSAFLNQSPDNSMKKLEQIRRECILYNYILCWHTIEEKSFEHNWKRSDFARCCITFFVKYGISVCYCTDNNLDFSGYMHCTQYTVKIPALNEEDRKLLWYNLCREYDVDIDHEFFSMRYKLSCRQTAMVFQRYSAERTDIGTSPAEKIRQICGDMANPSEKLFKKLTPGYKMSDLKLPESEKNTIYEICANFRYHFKIYSEWNMKVKVPYGRAISVLLMGPPGTGKTMTAHVIADMLELPLFHADLSQISDKYIGETSKHLDSIFTEAEKSNCVLLLDEADAICGKRSDVQDSKDRYANNDTAFLLQRLERYDGVVVLSTNFVNNLDNAFLRRMKFIIPFSIPDANVRMEIWKSCFPDEMPVSDDIDFEYLSQQFDFTGANIKNIVLEAAFLAASEDKPVDMKHILRGIGNEYLKFQKRILPGEFGKYSDEYNDIISNTIL